MKKVLINTIKKEYYKIKNIHKKKIKKRYYKKKKIHLYFN